MNKANERIVIHNLLKEHLRSIGIVSLSFRVRGLKKHYLITLYLLCAFLIFVQGFPFWILILPILPIIAFWILYIVDLNIMIQCLVVIQKILIDEYQLAYDFNELLDELQEYAKENNFFEIGGR